MSRARAADIIGTVTSPGWNDVLAIGKEVLAECQERLMKCDNDAEVLRLQHEAKAANFFFAEWQSRVMAAMQLEEAQEFSPVAY